MEWPYCILGAYEEEFGELRTRGKMDTTPILSGKCWSCTLSFPGKFSKTNLESVV